LIPEIVLRDFNFNNEVKELRLNSVSGKDQVAHYLYKGGWKAYESPLPLMIAQSVKQKHSAFFDIGANTGYYSIIAALAGASEVHAFEPVPSIMEALINNVKANPETSRTIKTYELGISNETSIKTIYMPDDRHGLLETSASLNKNFRGNHSDSFNIKCTTIDKVLSQIQFKMHDKLVFKIDVESHEPEALEGAQACISKFRPLIFLEILPDSDINFFYKWAYQNNYNHCTLLSPNKAIKSRTIEGNLGLRDHLFYPEETSLEHWLS
jgi:FkbM family methyltransferase